MNRSKLRGVFLLSICMLAITQNARAQYAFTRINLATSGDATAWGISNEGLVSGYYDNPSTGNVSSFLWQKGDVHSLDAPNGDAPTGTYLQKPGDSGLIVANLGGPDDFSTPAIYDSNRQSWTFLPRDPAGNAGTALFSKLTSNGSAVGHYYTLDLADPHHFLGPLIGHGVIWNGSGYSHFDVPGATSTLGFDINDAGQVIGEYEDASDTSHAYLKEGDTYVTIADPNADSTTVAGINDAGDIVGRYRVGDVRHGFVLSHGVFTTVDFPDAPGTWLTGINDSKELVGYYLNADGSTSAFIATPVPEPGRIAWMLTFAALGGWLASSRLRTGRVHRRTY